MEEGIKIILRNKKLVGVKEKIKEFASLFLKTAFSDQISFI
jgi:hypothetical protein